VGLPNSGEIPRPEALVAAIKRNYGTGTGCPRLGTAPLWAIIAETGSLVSLCGPLSLFGNRGGIRKAPGSGFGRPWLAYEMAQSDWPRTSDEGKKSGVWGSYVAGGSPRRGGGKETGRREWFYSGESRIRSAKQLVLIIHGDHDLALSRI